MSMSCKIDITQHKKKKKGLTMEKILDPVQGLEITEDMLSIHALTPFPSHNSSPRGIMMSSHITQAITLNNGEENIIQGGLEKQFGANTFSKKLENDSRIINIVQRYGGLGADAVEEVVELTVIYEDLVTGEISYLEVPDYFSLHQYFGFKYKWNEELLSSLTVNSIVPADTIIADSPSVSKNSGYKFGINAKVALLTIPEVAEDPIIISKTMAKKFEYTVFERVSCEYGVDKFILNAYGDDKNYQPFPHIGQKVNDDGIIMATRKYDPELSPALTSIKDTQTVDTMFDEAVYSMKANGTVTDVKVYKNSRFKKSTYNGTTEVVDRYASALAKYYREIIDVYEKLNNEHYRRFKDNNLAVSEKFNKLLLDAYAVVNPDNRKISKTYKNEEMDIYRVEITIAHTVTPKIGAKLTDLNGGAKLTDLI